MFGGHGSEEIDRVMGISFADVAHLMDQYGYVGLGLSLIVNCMGVPIASEVTLPFSGALVRMGTYDAATVFVVAVVSQMIGLSLSYEIARRGGVELLERYGKYVWLRPKHLARMQRLFNRHGAMLVLLGACIPGLHGYVGYPAGLAKMSFGRFVPIALLGVIAWTAAFLTIGWYLGGRWELLQGIMNNAGIIIFVVMLLTAAGIWYSKHHARQRTS